MILKYKKYETEPGFEEAVQAKDSNSLTVRPEDEFYLCIGTREAHWNVEGAHFYAFHKFFESQYDQLDKIVDNIS